MMVIFYVDSVFSSISSIMLMCLKSINILLYPFASLTLLLPLLPPLFLFVSFSGHTSTRFTQRDPERVPQPYRVRGCLSLNKS